MAENSVNYSLIPSEYRTTDDRMAAVVPTAIRAVRLTGATAFAIHKARRKTPAATTIATAGEGFA
jgi:hypothetical protein